WIALVPANGSDEFTLYGIHFEVKPGEYRRDSRLLRKAVSMASPSKMPKDAKLLNKNGKMQIFQPCPEKAMASLEKLTADQKALTFGITCSIEGKFELKAVQYPNTLLRTDRPVILSLTRSLSPLKSNPFVK